MAFWRTSDSLINPDDVRMTLGEHLEELRSRVIRAIVALVAGAIVCFVSVKYIITILIAPLGAVLAKYNLPTKIYQISPSEIFMMELKVAMIAGLIVTAPYALTQIWGFVAAGLYPHERKWVRRFTPVSIALFFVGAAFMLLVVAPVMLDFLLSYRSGYPRPEEFMPVLLHGQKQEPLPASPAQTPWPATLPAFTDQPPPDFPDGVLWLNPDTRDVNVRYGGQAYRFAHLEKVREHDRLEVEPMIRMSDYLLLVLGMMAAFGIGFQIPVVVALIATLGIATAKDMAAVRRHVIFAIAIAAAVITPSADLASMLALMIPMVLLFEAGLVAARFIERERASHSR